ncbi:MAG: DUF3099 domain-containing protein [Actinomycetota bacterium]|nr:DUF3099 domain-containing protein [Actinomycetota bacterium]
MGSGARDRLTGGATRWEALVRHDRSTDVSVVTSAGLSHSEDIALRQRRYILTQSVRIVCVILATALPVPVLYKAALLFGAIALPWFGVVMANAGPTVQRKDKTALRGAEPPLHRQIEPGRVIDAER